jgi:hypothetical protein
MSCLEGSVELKIKNASLIRRETIVSDHMKTPRDFEPRRLWFWVFVLSIIAIAFGELLLLPWPLPAVHVLSLDRI